MPLVQERLISRKRPAADRIENVEDARRIKTARVLDTTTENKLPDDAIKEVNLVVFLMLFKCSSAYNVKFFFPVKALKKSGYF